VNELPHPSNPLTKGGDFQFTSSCYANDKKQSPRQTYARAKCWISLLSVESAAEIPLATARIWAEVQLTSDSSKHIARDLIIVRRSSEATDNAPLICSEADNS
jgi:hypothetical protein